MRNGAGLVRAERPRRGSARVRASDRATPRRAAERAGDSLARHPDRDEGGRGDRRPAAGQLPAGPWVAEVGSGRDPPQQPAEKVRLLPARTSWCRASRATTNAISFRAPTGGSSSRSPTRRIHPIGTTRPRTCCRSALPGLSRPEEQDYLLDFVNTYLRQPLTRAPIRLDLFPARAPASTRRGPNRPRRPHAGLCVCRSTRTGRCCSTSFGGKYHLTYRSWPRYAVGKLGVALSRHPRPMDRRRAAARGDFPVDGVEGLIARSRTRHPFRAPRWAQAPDPRLCAPRPRRPERGKPAGRAWPRLGGTLTEAELRWLDHA